MEGDTNNRSQGEEPPATAPTSSSNSSRSIDHEEEKAEAKRQSVLLSVLLDDAADEEEEKKSSSLDEDKAEATRQFVLLSLLLDHASDEDEEEKSSSLDDEEEDTYLQDARDGSCLKVAFGVAADDTKEKSSNLGEEEDDSCLQDARDGSCLKVAFGVAADDTKEKSSSPATGPEESKGAPVPLHPLVAAGLPTGTTRSTASGGLQGAQAAVYAQEHELHNEVPTLPRARPRRPETLVRPGAMLVYPGQAPERMPWAGSLTTVNSSSAATTDTPLQETELVTARPVEEEHYGPIAEAQPVAPTAIGNRNPRRTLQKSKWAYLSLPLMVLGTLIAAVLGLSLVGQKSNETSSTTSSTVRPTPTWTATVAPTTMGDSLRLLLGADLDNSTIRAIQNNPTSPQARAYQWLLHDDRHHQWNNDTDTDRRRQRFALATLYYATSGENWNIQDYWLDHNASECVWYSRDSENINETYCSANNHMIPKLSLSSNNLKGTIPLELSLLSNSLTLLDLSNSDLGPIPSSLAALTQLTHLRLPFAELTGTLPSEWGRLTNLEILSVTENKQITGSIPTEFGLLTNLRDLYLAKMPLLTGTITFDYLGQLTNLKTLHLQSNTQLKGNLSSGAIGNLQSLERILLAHMDFAETTIPCTFLVFMNLCYCLSLFMGGQTVLTPNLFVPFLGPSLQCFAASVLPPFATTHIHICYAAEIGLLTNLWVFNMRGTSVKGRLPTELWNLVQMERLELDGNFLTGPLLSPSIGQMSHLKELYLSANPEANGSIPSTIGLLTDLNKLILHETDLTGTLPAEMRWLSLDTMTLSNTRLEGSIPDELCENMTDPWHYCKPSDAVWAVPDPNLAGTCFPQQNETDSVGDAKMNKCRQTLLCGCDCGSC